MTLVSDALTGRSYGLPCCTTASPRKFYFRCTNSGNFDIIASGGIPFNLTPSSCDSMIALAGAFARESLL